MHRATAGIYSSIDHVIIDIKDACSSVLEKLKTAEELARIKSFRRIAEELLDQEKSREMGKERSASQKFTGSSLYGNGIKPSKPSSHSTVNPAESKVVLTLFGNASSAKQMFSSLQEPIKTEAGKEIKSALQTVTLPHGISTTHIVPLEATEVSENRRPAQTFGDLFASSSATIPLPKLSRVGTTKSNIVGWYNSSLLENSQPKSNNSYFSQQVTCGQWLDYNVQRSKKQANGSNIVLVPKGADPTETQDEKLDALFKNAYSSFAPSRDDSAALIPEGTVSRIWWQKVGEKRFDHLVSNNEDTPGVVDVEAAESKDIVVMENVEQAIKELEDSAIDPALSDTPIRSIEEKDAEEVLQDISELLETLNSYQRNRHLSLAPARSADSFTLPEPEEHEISIYNILKSQLSLMIQMLPPYMVSKLNSDQLSELNISTKIKVLTDNYKGTMEEDEEAHRARIAELAKARPAASPSSHRTSSSSLYGNQYTTPRPSVPVPAPSQYYSQTPVRPPPAAVQRPPQTAPQAYAPRPIPGPGYRPTPSYPATPTYPHQVSRPSAAHYGAGGAQYYQNNQAQAYNQQAGYSGAPMTAPQGGRYQPPTAQYPQRPPSSQNTIGYNYASGSPAPRQPSPQKPQYSPQPPSAVPNRGYGTPTPAASNNQRYYAPPIPNGISANSGLPPAPNTPIGASGFHTVMSTAEQNSMMDRQRAQLAQQQGTQQQARSAAQPGSANGTNQMNGGSALTAG